MLQSKVTGTIKATQRINPRLGFFSAKYTNPKYPMYKMSSFSTWLLHAVLDKCLPLHLVLLLFLPNICHTTKKCIKVPALLHLLGSSVI